MGMSWQGESLIGGTASGTVFRLDAPLSFWGGVDPASGEICLAGHPQEGASITGAVLVIDRLVGSSSSSAVMLELLYRGIGPAALILGTRDAILSIGSLVAQQMGWTPCPVILLKDPPFATGDRLRIEGSTIYKDDA